MRRRRTCNAASSRNSAASTTSPSGIAASPAPWPAPASSHWLSPASPTRPTAAPTAAGSPRCEKLLSARQHQLADQPVDRALANLASQQKSDGSFAADDVAEPGVTPLCVLAFLSRGHLPSHGPFGDNITAAIN